MAAYGVLPAPLGRAAALTIAALYMAIAEVGVRFVKLPRLTRWLRISLSTAGVEPPPETVSMAGLRRRELLLLQALGVVAPKWPFADGPCLRQALVAGWILRRRGPRLRLGVARTDHRVLAHAWLEVDGVGTLGWQEGYMPLHDDPGKGT